MVCALRTIGCFARTGGLALGTFARISGNLRRGTSLPADRIDGIDRRQRYLLLFRCSFPPIVLAALVLLPFWGKPFTIDDVTFLLEAKHVLKDALHPAAFDMVFHGERIRL